MSLVLVVLPRFQPFQKCFLLFRAFGVSKIPCWLARYQVFLVFLGRWLVLRVKVRIKVSRIRVYTKAFLKIENSNFQKLLGRSYKIKMVEFFSKKTYCKTLHFWQFRSKDILFHVPFPVFCFEHQMHVVPVFFSLRSTFGALSKHNWPVPEQFEF